MRRRSSSRTSTRPLDEQIDFMAYLAASLEPDIARWWCRTSPSARQEGPRHPEEGREGHRLPGGEDRRAGRLPLCERVPLGEAAATPTRSALVEAVGKDLRELSAACQQLISDTTGWLMRRSSRSTTTARSRRRDSAGRRRRAGNTGETQAAPPRHQANGVDPVPIVAVSLQQLRQLGGWDTPAGEVRGRRPRPRYTRRSMAGPRRERSRPRPRPWTPIRPCQRRLRGQRRRGVTLACCRARHPHHHPGAGGRPLFRGVAGPRPAMTTRGLMGARPAQPRGIRRFGASGSLSPDGPRVRA